MSAELEKKAAFGLGNQFIHELYPDLVPLLQRIRPESRIALFEGMLCAVIGLASHSTNPDVARQILASVQQHINDPASKLDELHAQVLDTRRRNSH